MNKYTKKKQQKKPTVEWYIQRTNLLNLNVMLRTLYQVEGFRAKRLDRFTESYLALMQEIWDKRTNINEFNRDTLELTGIDAEEMLAKAEGKILLKGEES